MGKGPATKNSTHVRAGDVDLVPVHAKGEGTNVSVATEEGVSHTTVVTEGGTPPHNTQGCVGVLWAEAYGTVGVHGGEKGAQVAGA